MINRPKMRPLFTGNTYSTALATDGSAPVPTKSLPTGVNETIAVPCEKWPAFRFTFGGAADGGTINYRIVAWKKASNIYMPSIIANGVVTVGAMAMTVEGLDTVATLLADTITNALDVPGVMLRSPANNTSADITVWPGGADYLTVETDLGTATTCSCYVEVIDEAAAASLTSIAASLVNVATDDNLDALTTAPVAKIWTDCSQFVATAGTAEPLVGNQVFARALFLQAKKAAGDNTGNVFVGLEDLDQGVKEYIELAPGDYWEPLIPTGTTVDLNRIYIDADNTADGVVGFYTPA